MIKPKYEKGDREALLNCEPWQELCSKCEGSGIDFDDPRAEEPCTLCDGLGLVSKAIYIEQ